MALQKKTVAIIDNMKEILSVEHPQTLRQVHYRLCARYGGRNTKSGYRSHEYALGQARRLGLIAFEWVEDRQRDWNGNYRFYSREPQAHVDRKLKNLAGDVRDSFWLDVWDEQPRYIEVFCEKAALQTVFEQVCAPYHMRPNIGSGYTSLSALYKCAERMRYADDPLLLCWTDFDPSGEDMIRDLRERFYQDFDVEVEVRKIGLTREQVKRYQLPHDYTKAGDVRAEKHIAKYGDVAVELDALDLPILRQQIREAIEAEMDMDALRAVQQRQAEGRAEIERIMAEMTAR